MGNGKGGNQTREISLVAEYAPFKLFVIALWEMCACSFAQRSCSLEPINSFLAGRFGALREKPWPPWSSSLVCLQWCVSLLRVVCLHVTSSSNTTTKVRNLSYGKEEK